MNLSEENIESILYNIKQRNPNYTQICKICGKTRGRHHGSYCDLRSINSLKRFMKDENLSNVAMAIYNLHKN